MRHVMDVTMGVMDLEWKVVKRHPTRSGWSLPVGCYGPLKRFFDCLGLRTRPFKMASIIEALKRWKDKAQIHETLVRKSLR